MGETVGLPLAVIEFVRRVQAPFSILRNNVCTLKVNKKQQLG